MALRTKLELRQGQSLVMTPQLQQAIKLLQMSNLDLAEFIEDEMASNPLLEVAAAADEAEPPDIAITPPIQERLEGLDTDVDNVYADEALADRQDRDRLSGPSDSGWNSLSPGSSGGFEDARESGIEATVSQEPSLYDHLEWQVGEAMGNPVERIIGAHLVRQIDGAGYFTGDLDEIAAELGIDVHLAERCLQKIQGFDPTGIGARSLRECLALQLEERGHLTLEMDALLDNLPLLAQRDFARLKKICDVDGETLHEMIAQVRQLDPKPAARFGSFVVQPVIPDVLVSGLPDGSWLVELNSETLPRVLVNRQYYAHVSRSGLKEKEREYLADCQANASWLVKSLEQRARTILKVARELVRQQDLFLVRGVQFLRPLNLKIIAEAIEMHESTVSRVTANKYMATPRGVFEMKYFFTTAIPSVEGGDSYSAEAVRHRIRELVDNEAPDEILSDDRIVDLLRGGGIEIARRTVTKYREALGILSSVQRRREKSVSR